MKKILTESQRLQRNAYAREYRAKHKDLPKPGRLKSSYPFDRHRWKRIKSRLDRLIEEYGWPEVELVIEAVRPEHQTTLPICKEEFTEF